MTGQGPIAALLERWWARAVRLEHSSKACDDYNRGERKGRAKGIADCARELDDILTTIESERWS